MSTKSVSGWRSIVAAGALTVVGALAAAPAFADGHGRGGDRWGDHGYRDHDRGNWHRDADRGRDWPGYRGGYEHRWEGRYGYGGPYYRYPPVYRQYYAPGYFAPDYPAAYYPPPAYYGPPAPGIGLVIRVPLF